MPEQEIQENQRIFKHEFSLADAFWQAIAHGAVSNDIELRADLEASMAEYLRAVDKTNQKKKKQQTLSDQLIDLVR